MNRWVQIAWHSLGAFAFFYVFGRYVLNQPTDATLYLAAALAAVAAFIAWRQTQPGKK